MPFDESLAGRVRELLWDEPDLIEKKMFGGLGFMVGGHLAVAVSSNGGLLVRVGAAHEQALLAEPHTAPMSSGPRAMPGWLRVDQAGLETDAELGSWVARGLDCVYTLPPKS